MNVYTEISQAHTHQIDVACAWLINAPVVQPNFLITESTVVHATANVALFMMTKHISWPVNHATALVEPAWMVMEIPTVVNAQMVVIILIRVLTMKMTR